MENKIILEKKNKEEFTTIKNPETGLDWLKIRKKLTTREKGSIAKIVTNSVYNISFDKNDNIDTFDLAPNILVLNIITKAIILSRYIVNVDFPKDTNGEIDYIELESISDSIGLYELLLDSEIGNDMYKTILTIDEHMENMNVFVTNKLNVVMLEKLEESIKIFNKTQMEILDKTGLENEQLRKTLDLMPTTSEGMKEQVELMSEQVNKLKDSEIYEIADKVGFRK